MMVAAPKRMTRRDPGGSRVTPRDLLALRFIADAQPVTTGQVRRLLGLSEDMAHRRLAVLRDHGLVRVHVQAQHVANRYTLAPAAAPVLARLTGASPEEIWVPRGIDRADLSHHEAAVDVYVAVQQATTRSKRTRLIRWLFEREIRRATGQGAGTLVPDAAGLFEREDASRFAVVFEVDLGTENPNYVATHKGLAYGQLAGAGTPVLGTGDWSVACVVAAPERRLHRLALATAEVGVPARLWHFALSERLDDRALLGRSWVTPVVDPAANTVSLASSSPFDGVGTMGRNSSDGSTRQNPASQADRGPAAHRAFASKDVR